MEIRHNNVAINVDELDEKGRENLARSIAFARDAAVSNLVTLGFPEDHPYEPQVVEAPVAAAKPAATDMTGYQGFSLNH